MSPTTSTSLANPPADGAALECYSSLHRVAARLEERAAHRGSQLLRQRVEIPVIVTYLTVEARRIERLRAAATVVATEDGQS